MSVAALPELPRRGEVIEAKRETDDEVLWSVTTIISTLAKERLLPWAVKVTAERVVANLSTLMSVLEHQGEEAAVKYVTGLRFQLGGRLSDADLGTVAHGLFDAFAFTGARPEIVPELHPKFPSEQALLHEADLSELARMVDQFDRWLQGYQPQYWSTELIVYSPLRWTDDDGNEHRGYGYAGQVDAFAVVDGVPLIVDYKTSRKTYDTRGNIRAPFPEVGLQLAAYRYAPRCAQRTARRYHTGNATSGRRFYLLSPAERAAAAPVPVVDGGLALRITPEHLGVHPVRCDERDHEAFLHIQEAARWVTDDSGHVVGNAMPPLHWPEQTDPFDGLPEF